VAEVSTNFIAAGCAIIENVLEWCPKTGFIFFAASTSICVARHFDGRDEVCACLFAYSHGILEIIGAHTV
jgi:hypothetical protein